MRNSKLIKLLRSLSREELKRFDEFVRSPYHNRNSNLVKLCRYLNAYSPGYKSERLEKEYVYAEIFPGRRFNLKVMKNLMSGLAGLLLKFMELENYGKKPGDKYTYLLEELLKRNQYSVFGGTVKKAESALDSLPFNEEYFYNKLRLYDLSYSYSLRTARGMESVKMPDELIDSLFSFFLIYYFKYHYNLLVKKFAYNFEADMDFIQSVIAHVKSQNFRNKEIILIYYNLFMAAFYHEEEEYFSSLRKLVNDHGMGLDKSERFNVYSAMQGYCLREIKRNSAYKETFFSICAEMVSNGAYSNLDSGLILPLIYKNIVKSAVGAGEFPWALDFIESFRPKLLPVFQNNVYYYSLALCYFKMGDYGKSLETLSVVKYENVYDKADVNRLLLQIYFETGLTEELYSLMDTFKHFVHNNKKISVGTRTGILNFINFSNSIYRLSFSRNAEWEALELKKTLLELPTFDTVWLLEKVERYIKKNPD